MDTNATLGPSGELADLDKEKGQKEVVEMVEDKESGENEKI